MFPITRIHLPAASHKLYLQHAKWKYIAQAVKGCLGCAVTMCTELTMHTFAASIPHLLEAQTVCAVPFTSCSHLAICCALCLPALRTDAWCQPKTPLCHCGCRNTLPGLMAPWDLQETMSPVKLKLASAQAKQRLQKQLYAPSASMPCIPLEPTSPHLYSITEGWQHACSLDCQCLASMFV